MIINTATSIDVNAVLNLISALAKRQNLTGKKTYFIHVCIIPIYVGRALPLFSPTTDSRKPDLGAVCL